MNSVDSAMADGGAEPEEQALFENMRVAFEIHEDEFKPFFEILIMKNDRGIFLNQNHPSNSADFKVNVPAA